MSQLLPVQFRGVDQAADPKGQPPGTLLVATNCAMDKARRLIKRAGTTGLTKSLLAGGSVAAGARILPRGSHLAVHDGTHVQSYSTDVSAWAPIARPTHLSVTRQGLADSTRSVSCATSAMSGDLLVTAYQCSSVATGTVLYVQVDNVVTGARAFGPYPFSGGSAYPRVLIEGSTAYLVCSDSGGAIYVTTFDLATLTLSASQITVATNGLVGTCAMLDAVIGDTAGGRTMFFVYEKSGGANRRVHSALLSSLGVALAGADVAVASAATALCIDVDATTVHLAHSSAVPATIYTTMTVNLTGAASTTVEAIEAHSAFVKVFSATQVLYGYVRNAVDGSPANQFVTHLRTITTRAIVASTTRTTSYIMRPTKPWSVGGRWYVLGAVVPRTQFVADPIPSSSSVVLEIETTDDLASTLSVHQHAATAENQTGWFSPVNGYLSQVAVSGTAAYVPAAYRNREPTFYRAVPIGWNLYRFAVMEGDLGRCTVLGGGALAAGGAPLWLDGGGPCAYGFVHGPVIRGTTPTAGGSMAVGTYFYIVVYEWRDKAGVLHRSMPSPPYRGITAGANLSISLEIATTDISTHQFPFESGANAANPVSIAIYRTTANGSTYYRLTYEPLYQVLFNEVTLGYVTLVDTKADSNIAVSVPAITLATQPQLYTGPTGTGGELEDVPPPAFGTVTTHKGRLVGVGPDQRTLWFSKDQTQDPQVAPGFNEVLTLGFASDKTALASLGERLAVLGPSSIDLVFGDGPDATGVGGWQVQGVQTDIGCTNPRSVVGGSMGVLFQSTRGIELLGTDTLVSWIGKPVEDDVAAFPTITSAVLVASAHEIRFTCTAEDGLTGIVLAWDYFHSIWFRRTYTDASDTDAASVPFVDAALVGGAYTMLTAGGQVYQETAAHKLDGGTTYVAREVVMAPMSPSTPMSWHRVKDVSVMGTSVTDHDLSVSVARDFATTYEQTKTFLAQSDATTIGPLERCRVTLMNQKCRSVQIRLRDTVPTAPGALGTGDGPIWEGLAFRVMTKDGPAKTSSGRQG